MDNNPNPLFLTLFAIFPFRLFALVLSGTTFPGVWTGQKTEKKLDSRGDW